MKAFAYRNRVLKDVTLGRQWRQQNTRPLTCLSAVIGKNGSGKSSLFDAFGFLADCMTADADKACRLRDRGGFDSIVSRGSSGPVRFQLCYRESPDEEPCSYALTIDLDRENIPRVKSESLSQGQKGKSEPLCLLNLESGQGFCLRPENGGHVREPVTLNESRQTGVDALGAFREYRKAAWLRQYVRSWHLSYFTPHAARTVPRVGHHTSPDPRGDNLGNIVRLMEKNHPERFQRVLGRMTEKIPEIRSIHTEISGDGRLHLRFSDRRFQGPFHAREMSDGTLKMLAYLLLTESPDPAPFICFEEPETELYHKLLESLVSDFRENLADSGKGPHQIFMTTHQPCLADTLAPEEVWILERKADGFSSITRAGDDPVVRAMADEGLPVGSLWYSGYLDAG